MKLTIKSLTGTNFTLDAEPSDTVSTSYSKRRVEERVERESKDGDAKR